MDVRRGMKRLAIAVGVPWFGFWGLVAWVNYGRLNDPTGSQRQYDSAYENLGSAMWWGIIMPVIALIALGIAYWVYRGFKPKP